MRSKLSFTVSLLALLIMAPGLAHARIGRLVGRVLDTQGNPIEGVDVVATAKALPDFRVEDTTDRKGTFKVDIPERNVVYLLRFEKAGLSPLEAEITWELDSGTERKDFTMHPAGMVELGTEEVASASSEAIAAFNAGVQAYLANDYATAQKDFQTAVDADPELRQGWSALALAHFQQGHNQEAAEAADKAVALGAKDARVLRARWQAYRNLGDEAKAAAALADLQKTENAVEVAKKTYNEGVSLLKSGDDQNALQKFQDAADLDPNLKMALVGVADTALKLGRNQQAATAAEQILAQDPSNEDAARIRYNAYLALGDPDKLVDALVGLAPYEPKVAHDGLLKMAFDAYDAEDMPKARARFLKVLDLKPDDTVALYYVALVEVNQGLNQQAIQHLEKFLQLAPSDKEAQTAQQMLDYLKTH